jgi:hypothetical protein
MKFWREYWKNEVSTYPLLNSMTLTNTLMAPTTFWIWSSVVMRECYCFSYKLKCDSNYREAGSYFAAECLFGIIRCYIFAVTRHVGFHYSKPSRKRNYVGACRKRKSDNYEWITWLHDLPSPKRFLIHEKSASNHQKDWKRTESDNSWKGIV